MYGEIIFLFTACATVDKYIRWQRRVVVRILEHSLGFDRDILLRWKGEGYAKKDCYPSSCWKREQKSA